MDRISCQKCDVVLPLVAIATPIEYTRNPLRVFELDFEENLRIIRYCVKYRKRVVFRLPLKCTACVRTPLLTRTNRI